MARFRKVETRIWNDEKFRDLSDQAKLVFLLILTHPHMASLGAMRETIPGLAAELGWEEETLSEGFREGLAKGLLEHDPKACFVGLPNFLKYNAPENPNVVLSWIQQADLIPECEAKKALVLRVKIHCQARGKAFVEAFRKAFGEPLGNRWGNRWGNPVRTVCQIPSPSPRIRTRARKNGHHSPLQRRKKLSSTVGSDATRSIRRRGTTTTKAMAGKSAATR